jgi:hypothetical protein
VPSPLLSGHRQLRETRNNTPFSAFLLTFVQSLSWQIK